MTKKKAKPKRKVSKKKSKTKSKSKSKSKAKSKSKPKSKESAEVKALKEQQKKDLARLEKQQQAEIRRIEKARIAKDKKDKKDKAREKRRIARDKKSKRKKEKKEKADAKRQRDIDRARKLLETEAPELLRGVKEPEVKPPVKEPIEETIHLLPYDEKVIAKLLREKHIMPPAYCKRCHYSPCKRLSKYQLTEPEDVRELKDRWRKDQRYLELIEKAVTIAQDEQDPTKGLPHTQAAYFVERGKKLQISHTMLKYVPPSQMTDKLKAFMKSGNMEPHKKGKPIRMAEKNQGGLTMAGYKHHWNMENPNHDSYKFPCIFCFLDKAYEMTQHNIAWSLDDHQQQLLEEQCGTKLARVHGNVQGEFGVPSEMPLYSWIAFRNPKTEWSKDPMTNEDIRIPVNDKHGKQKMTNLGTLYVKAMRNFNRCKDVEGEQAKGKRRIQVYTPQGTSPIDVDNPPIKIWDPKLEAYRWATEDEIVEMDRKERLRKLAEALREYQDLDDKDKCDVDDTKDKLDEEDDTK